MSRRTKKDIGRYRSGFEKTLGDKLDAEGVKFGYETDTFKITVPVRGVRCVPCKSKDIVRDTRYTPDFFFDSWIIEAKGRFTANDRKRVLALLGSPDMLGDERDFGMLFMYDNKISKSSETRYSDWCKKNDVPYAFGYFKKEWLR